MSFSDNDLGSAAGCAVAAGVLLWVGGLLGLPANVRIFVYAVAGFAALFAVAQLIDSTWLALKRRRSHDRTGSDGGEGPEV